MNIVKIGENLVGGNNPPYILAEIGVNHMGDAELAHNMIMNAAFVGAHGVKFQTFKADKLVSKIIDPDQVDYFKQYELSYAALKYLKEIADHYCVDFISTPFDIESLEYLVELGVPAIKISSGDMTYYPLIKAARDTGLPLIISTGMATLQEVNLMLKDCGLINNVILLHCVSLYPTKNEEANLRAIPEMIKAFPQHTIGYSDHTKGVQACIASVALGASFIEKHFTLHHDLPGADHEIAATPDELKQIFNMTYHTQKLLGDGLKKPQERELANRDTMRRNPSDWLRPLKRDNE